MKINWPPFLRIIGKTFVDWYYGWVDFEVMTLIWLLAQATIILGPAATFGVYYAVHARLRSGENVGLQGMFLGAKMYFWRSLGWGVLNWAVILLSAYNFYFYNNIDLDLGFIIRLIVALLLVLWMITQFYALPMFMVQDKKSIFLALRNGFFLAFSALLPTIGTMVFAGILAGMCIWLIIPTFIGFPVLIITYGSRAVYDRLESLGLLKKDIDPREVG